MNVVQGLSRTRPNTKAPSTLTLRRVGYFTFRTSGASHCGTGNDQQARYEITCRCGAHSLDSRGFLFDQTHVESIFAGVRNTHLSCEELCYTAAKAIYRLAVHENPRLAMESLSVQISPEPYAASMTWEWSR